MLRLLVPIAIIAAPAAAAAATISASSASAASASLATAPWWEKITVTMSGDGEQQSCRYETSVRNGDAPDCSMMSKASADASKKAIAAKEELATITFERRFMPGSAEPKVGLLQPGDTLLGGEVMRLSIDARGKVSGCTVVASGGDMKPDYGCSEVTAELFQPASQREATREGYMTILVYGHTEHVT